MTVEVTLVAPDIWADRAEQLAQLLRNAATQVIPDPTGQPADPNTLTVITSPWLWAVDVSLLREALLLAAGTATATSSVTRLASGAAAAAVEDRLVFTVEEAATLLGISRSFAYEAVQRGEVPSMRIGRRILVPKAALHKLLGGESNPKVEH